MVKYENQCRDCAVNGYPCMGDDCCYRNVKVYVCDCCYNEMNELYEYDTGEQLCTDCLLRNFKKVKE